MPRPPVRLLSLLARTATTPRPATVWRPHNLPTSNLQLPFCSCPPHVVSDSVYAREAGETLESLGDHFCELLEDHALLAEGDATLADGVLTVKLGGGLGTYVVNKQTPNKQIWLSSPASGPARFDLVGGRWIYSHTGESLHELLDRELGEVVGEVAGFRDCYLGQ